MPATFSFKGVIKPYLYITESLRPAWSPIEHEILEIPGRPGGIITRTKEGIGTLSISVAIDVPLGRTLEDIKEEMAEWLFSEKEEPLIFTDRPNRVYYARIDGMLDSIVNLVTFGKGTLTFIYPSGRKYGPEKTSQIVGGVISTTNLGTAPTRPVIEAIINEPTTYLDIYNDESYMRIGTPTGADDGPQREFDWILKDEANSLGGWQSATWVPDGGVKAGTLKTTGDVFYTDSYGTGPKWHGPAMTKSLTSTLEDYQIRVTFILETTDGKSKGRAEVYLLDTLGAIMGKIAVVTNGGRGIVLEVNLRNGLKSHYVTVQRDLVSRLFHGHLILRKKGTRFSVEIGLQSLINFRVTRRFKISYTDILNEFQTPLAGVGVHLGAYSTAPAPKLNRIRGVFVQRWNTLTGVPYIADIGDIVTIDFEKSSIHINDEERKDLKDFGATFFPLQSGTKTLIVEPTSTTGELRYREAFR